MFLSVNPKADFRSKNGFRVPLANPNPDFLFGESFLKKDLLDLKSEESKSRLMD